jgi:CubicO group peptidase (beta-lactamase class C family)
MGNPVTFLQPYKEYNIEKLFAYLKKASPIGTGKFDYSNLGMGLAGVLAERIAKKSLQDLYRSYILRPFGLKHSSFEVNTKQSKSVGYFNDQQIAEYWDMSCLAGAGGLKSNAKDILAYLHFCVKNYSTPLIQLVTAETASINKRIALGRGWHILKSNPQQPIFWHNGGTYGFSTFAAFNPVSQKIVFVAVNAFNKNAVADELGVKIMQGLLSR